MTLDIVLKMFVGALIPLVTVTDGEQAELTTETHAIAENANKNKTKDPHQTLFHCALNSYFPKIMRTTM